MNNIIKDELLQREVSRKQFLQYIGLLLIAVTGIAGLIQSLHGNLPAPKNLKLDGKDYGMSDYGI